MLVAVEPVLAIAVVDAMGHALPHAKVVTKKEGK